MGWGQAQTSKSRNHQLQVPGKQLQGCPNSLSRQPRSTRCGWEAGIPVPERERVRSGQAQRLGTGCPWSVCAAPTASGSVPGSVPSSSRKGNHFNKSELWDSCLRVRPKSNP